MTNKYEWAIEDIFKSVEEWNTLFLDTDKESSFDEFRGKLNDKSSFLACMKKQERVCRNLDRLYVYAMMLHDTDTANSSYDALLSKAINLSTKLSSNLSFVLPELTALDESVLNGYLADSELSEYDCYIKEVLKSKPHVLSEAEEKLLAQSGEALSSFKEIFTKIDNADLPLKEIVYKGQKIPLSHGSYGVIMHGEDRALRKKCFKEYYGSYISLINTISATYYGSVKKDVFYANARNYNSTLEKALSGEDVDKRVYENLIETTSKALPLLHRFIKLKKQSMGLKSMHMYDVYAPMTDNYEFKLEYDEAYDLVIKGLSVLGDEYVKLLTQARDNRWISVYETPNKKSGAYSVAVYDTHPYVLLNYQKTTHDVFTIAHEMGHSIHSYFSNKTQPYMKADYKIFVAEVASTVNEVLLIKYLLKNATDNNAKKYLLTYLMEMIRTTLFRQTQFAEFEYFTHAQVEKGEPLTKEILCEKYLELNKAYYGKSVISDDEIKYEWARIPHFYRAFYVYKYSTGIISALAISDRILTEGKVAIDDYFKFLSSGCSDNPVSLLKIAGVDLLDKNTFTKAFNVFADALDEFSTL